ncbi:hypothetical protein LIER_43273 [Lithospermum erythrorhizon]|uniref:Uncharacterized protein n=1 Tax=Lithospermum erythrorhizon TaxID=34254 RepID=A0AAV3PS38_LITER
MLTEFFRIYAEGCEPTKYLYWEFLEYYRWIPQQRIWQRRVSQMKAIGRLYSVSPFERREILFAQALAKAHKIQMPKALHRLFATILIYTNSCDVRKLWDDNFDAMVEDYPRASDTNNVFIKNKLLNDISKLLEQHNKKLKDFDLPQMIEGFEELTSTSTMIEDELTIPVSNERHHLH